MRQTVPLPASQFPLAHWVFVGYRQSLLGNAPSRHYLCNPYTGAWTHTPLCFPVALTRFFPENIGVTFVGTRFAHKITSAMQLRQRAVISELQSFVYLQAPAFARPPGCSHRSDLLGGQAVYTTHRPDGYPFRDVASLRVQHGQLTRLDFHQLDCGLVGCSSHIRLFSKTHTTGDNVYKLYATRGFGNG
jgi:hypothetical protein